jgi:hypothetical protein
MAKTLAYIADTFDINPIISYNVETYIYIDTNAESKLYLHHYIDNIITIMKEYGFRVKLSCILYYNQFMIEFYNDHKRIHYYFNNKFPYDYHNILKNTIINILIVKKEVYYTDDTIQNMMKKHTILNII